MNDIYKRVTLRLLPLLIVIYLFAYIDRSVVGFAKLQLSADIGLSDAAYGLGAGIFFIAYAIFEVPSNIILTKVGARAWFARIMISWGAITMAMSLINSEWMFYLLRVLLGAAEAGFYPGILYFITRWFPNTRRARVVGLFLLANPIALAIGGPISGGLMALDGVAGLAGWQWLFLVVGLPPVLLAFVVLKVLPNSPREAKWLTADEVERIENDISTNDDRTGAIALPHPLAALRNGRVWTFALLFLTYSLMGYALSLWLPQIVSNMGVGTVTTGWLSALPWIAALIALLWIPRRAERRASPYAHMGVVLAIAAVALVVSGVATNPWVQMLALCAAAFGIYAGQPIFWGLPSQVLTGVSAAAALAFINTVGAVGGFVGPYGVGAITELTGDTRWALLALAGVAVYGLVMIALVRRMMRRHAARFAAR